MNYTWGGSQLFQLESAAADKYIGSYPLIGQLDYQTDDSSGANGPLERYGAWQIFSLPRIPDLSYNKETSRKVTLTVHFTPHVARHVGKLVMNVELNNGKSTTYNTTIDTSSTNSGITRSFTFNLTELVLKNEPIRAKVTYGYYWEGYDTSGPQTDNSAAVYLTQTELRIDYDAITVFQPPETFTATLLAPTSLKDDLGNYIYDEDGGVIFGPESKIRIEWSDVVKPLNSLISEYRIYYTFNDSGFSSDLSQERYITIYEAGNELPPDGNVVLYIQDLLASLNTTFDTLRKKPFYYGIVVRGGYIGDVLNSAYDSVFISKNSGWVGNTKPSAPSVSNSIISIPVSGEGKLITVTAGNDSDYQNYKVGLSGTNDWKFSPGQFRIKEEGIYNFVTWDGMEESEPTRITATFNEIPVAKIDELSIQYDNNKITAAGSLDNEGLTNPKTATLFQWFMKYSNNLENFASVSWTPITEQSSALDKPIELLYLLNPLEKKHPYFGEYFQIGLKIKDNEDWSEIATDGQIYQMYGQLPSGENNITLSSTHGLENYLNYFISRPITDTAPVELKWRLPQLPNKITQLYYQLFYSIDNAASWRKYGTQYNYTEGQKEITILIDTSSIKNNVIFKIELYDLENNPSQISQFYSNKLYYAAPPEFSSTFLFEISEPQYPDKRDAIRPNYYKIGGLDSQQNFSWSTSVPSSVCHLVGRIQDLQYQATLYTEGETRSAIVQPYKNCTQGEVSKLDINSFSYDVFNQEGLYNKLVDNSYLVITFRDIFGQTVNSPNLMFTVDFREKPYMPEALLLDSPKLLDNTKSFSAALNYPLNFNQDAQILILNNEQLIAVFKESQLSYKGQIIDSYQFNIFDTQDNLIKTIIVPVSNIVAASDFKEGLNGKAAVLYIDNIFNIAQEYYLTISAIDSNNSYNGYISNASQFAKKFIGAARTLPYLSISNLSVKDSETDSSIGIINISSSNFEDAWPQKYTDYPYFSRLNNDFTPLCGLYLQLSSSNTFTNSTIYRINEISGSNDLSTICSSVKTQTIEDSNIKTYNKVFIRAYIQLDTGLQLNSAGQIGIDRQIIYSNIIIYSGNGPTVLYRKNGVGINNIPNANEILLAEFLGSRKYVTFKGAETTETGTNEHQLQFDLEKGSIEGTNFLLKDSLFNESWIIASHDWEQLSSLEI